MPPAGSPASMAPRADRSSVLDGFELPARRLGARGVPRAHGKYDPSLLDMLCLTGQVGWAPALARAGVDGAGATPVALFLREHVERGWPCVRAATSAAPPERPLSRRRAGARPRHARHARRVVLPRSRRRVQQDEATLRTAIAELVAAGRVTSDGFAGLRSIVQRSPAHRRMAAGRSGLWSAVEPR